MLKKENNILKTAALLVALAALAIAASSCGQAGAPEASSVYTTGSYEVPWGLALNGDSSLLYSVNYLKSNVAVYDAETMSLLYQIPTLENPFYLAFNADYSRLFVTHKDCGTELCKRSQTSNAALAGTYISVIDVATKKVVKEIDAANGVADLRDIVFDENNNVFYVLGSNNGKILVVDAGLEKVVGAISYDTSLFKPIRIRLDSVSNTMYVMDMLGGKIEIKTPVDPKNLEFQKAGYDKYKDGYCVNTLKPENCRCSTAGDCASGACKTSELLPYCESMECVATSVSAGSCVESKDGTTNCKVVDAGNSCSGIARGNSCASILATTTVCGNDATCAAAYENTSTCNMTTLKCDRKIFDDNLCASGYACNQTSGYCEKTIDIPGACAAGYSCVSGTCEKTSYNDSLCDAAKGETCNASTGKCKTTTYKDSLCSTGYSCDRADGVCKINTYPNGCECDFDSQCVGYAEGTAFCSIDGKCLTYSSVKVDIGGFCDTRYNDACYKGTDVEDYNKGFYDSFSGVSCSSPTDILLLPDKTAYVACYGGATSKDTGKDPIYKITLNADGIAFDANKTLGTFNSLKICDKPMKMAADKDGKTALIICDGNNKIYAVDVLTGAVFKNYNMPDHPIDIIVSRKAKDNYFYVSGSSADNITRYPIPFY